ncbi:MAG: hypothetical protein HY830_06210 [Actinobacteria bacterium]|nr:hypothetical protein [Actinomycetota bacterium]
MTAHLVQAPPSGFTRSQVATLAGLPETYAAAASGSVRIVDGAPGWVDRAVRAVDSGVRALVVDRPAPEPVAQVGSLRDLARAHSVVVAVDSPYVGSPTWGASRDRLLADVAGIALLDAVAVVGDPRDLERALLAQVAVVRPLLRRTTLRRSAPGSSMLVTDDGDLVTSVAATVSVTPGLVLELVGARVRWRIELPDDGTARPGRAVRHDATGETAIRPIYATSSRSTWLALAARLDGSSTDVLYDLDALLLDLEVLAGGLPAR